jgi:hypothetical protein
MTETKEQQHQEALEALRRQLVSERDALQSSLEKEIDRLKALLEEEKQNMGAAGKRREDELL